MMVEELSPRIAGVCVAPLSSGARGRARALPGAAVQQAVGMAVAHDGT